MSSSIIHSPASVPGVVAGLPGRPVVRVRSATGDPMWLVQDQALARRVLGDRRFSRAAAAQPGAPALNSANPVPDSLTGRDGAEHARLRRTVAGWFTARRLAGLTPYIERAADDLAERLGRQPAPADLIGSFAAVLPLTVLLHVIGIPPEDRDLFASYVNVLFDSDEGDPVGKRRRGIALAGYMASLVDRLAAEPAPGLLSSLVSVHQAGGLSRPELVNLGLALLTAGYETTADQIGMSALAMLSDPALREALRDPDRRTGVTEELLRLMPATPVSFARVATERLRLADVTVEAGEAVIVSILAVNRDPQRSACPHRMELDGTSAPHLTFGYGPHYCLGAPLARIQVGVALETLLRRFPALRLAGPDAATWKNQLLTCGLASLMVSW
jgi:cytochrome P450